MVENTEKKKIKVMSVVFENDITPKEIPLFRGVVMHTAGKEHELFHNHTKNDQLRYAYPLIQYKRKHKKPMLVCIDVGIESSYHFFHNHQEGVLLGKRKYDLTVQDIFYETTELKMLGSLKEYSLSNWLPLNQKNFDTFKTLSSELDRLAFLERMLIGNILSFAKGVNWFLQDKVELRITKILKSHNSIIKKTGRLAFDLQFVSNINLPKNIGLGKNASTGYGVLKPLRIK